MKHLAFFFIIALVFTACKNDKTQTTDLQATDKIILDSGNQAGKTPDGLTLFNGDFIYYADAAVLQTKQDIYGVIANNKMTELNTMAEAFKKEATDYVTVSVRGHLKPKPENEEGWPFRIEIKEILSVSAPNPETNNVVKLESK
ncbi:hypothetical protein ACFSQP_05555 [Bizionia sediminis]|uniref:NlpE C-terminal OB domain-containing protein n=1 Tax=Bizionia sediminis TaxID=1737064 RepID=A0ABW5KUP5_9FLAO